MSIEACVKKHNLPALILVSLVFLCGIGFGRGLYFKCVSLLDTNIWIALQQANRCMAECDAFSEALDRQHNLYYVVSRIAGSMTDGIVTNGYCVAKREADGRLAWDSPENHLLAAYWDENDAERGEQFRNKSVQYVMPPGWTNDLKNVWVDREKLAEYVDIAIKENAKIGNELMRIKTAYSYDSEGRPEIELSAMANVVRCYWCARMVRCAEKGELESAKNELCALIDMAETITCYGKTEKELGFAKDLLQNARECLRAILPKIKGDEVYSLCLLETIRVSLDLIRVARPPKERAALAEMLHEIDMLRKEWQNEIEDFLREEECLHELDNIIRRK